MAEAALWLTIARMALLVVPFRVLASHLGQALPPADAAAKMAALSKAADTQEQAREIGWAVRRISVYIHALCLQQALAANFMLRRRGIPSALHLGVAKRKNPEAAMSAHAWLDAPGTRITGYPAHDQYIEVVCFLGADTLNLRFGLRARPRRNPAPDHRRDGRTAEPRWE